MSNPYAPPPLGSSKNSRYAPAPTREQGIDTTEIMHAASRALQLPQDGIQHYIGTVKVGDNQATVDAISRFSPETYTFAEYLDACKHASSLQTKWLRERREYLKTGSLLQPLIAPRDRGFLSTQSPAFTPDLKGYEAYQRIWSPSAGLWSDLVDEGVGGVSSVMVEITDGRIRHGGGYRRWTATARQDGRGRSAALRAAPGGAADAEPRDRGGAAHDDLVDDRGRRRLVRNGHAPSRAIQTGIGPIEVRRPRVHDRGAGDAPRIRFKFGGWAQAAAWSSAS